MNLHEYQAKQLFAEFGLPVPEGYACDTPQEAFEAAGRISTEKKVVKKKIVIVDKDEPIGGGSAPQLPKHTSEEAVASIPEDHSVPKPAPVIIPKIKGSILFIYRLFSKASGLRLLKQQ